MIFGVILMILAICLTLYIVFSAVKCRNVLVTNRYDKEDHKQVYFTSVLSKITFVTSLLWWISLLLVKFMESNIQSFHPILKIEGTLFLSMTIIIILGILLYRNHMYRKYLKDNVIRTILVEYSLSFIMGILYAYILTYAFEAAIIIF